MMRRIICRPRGNQVLGREYIYIPRTSIKATFIVNACMVRRWCGRDARTDGWRCGPCLEWDRAESLHLRVLGPWQAPCLTASSHRPSVPTGLCSSQLAAFCSTAPSSLTPMHPGSCLCGPNGHRLAGAAPAPALSRVAPTSNSVDQ